MKNTRATYRYAKSLLELAKEQGTLEVCKTDMETVVSICKDSRELMLLLKSPVVKTDKKQAIFSEIFGSCSDLTMSFIQLITQKKREAPSAPRPSVKQRQQHQHQDQKQQKEVAVAHTNREVLAIDKFALSS